MLTLTIAACAVYEKWLFGKHGDEVTMITLMTIHISKYIALTR